MECPPVPRGAPQKTQCRWDRLPDGSHIQPPFANSNSGYPSNPLLPIHQESSEAPMTKAQRKAKRKREWRERMAPNLAAKNAPASEAQKRVLKGDPFPKVRGPPKKQKREDVPALNRQNPPFPPEASAQRNLPPPPRLPQEPNPPFPQNRGPSLDGIDLGAELDSFYIHFKTKMQFVSAAHVQAHQSEIAEIEALRHQKEALVSRLEARDKQLKKEFTLRGQIEQASKRAEEELQARNDALSQEIESLKAELETKVQEGNEKLRQAMARCHEMEAKWAELESENKTALKGLETVKEECKIAVDKAIVVEQRLSAETVAKNVLAVRLKASKADSESWQKIVQGMRGRLEEARGNEESKTQVRALATLQEHCTSLEKHFGSLSDKLGLQSSKPQDIRLAIIALQTKLKSAEEKASQTERKRRESENRLQEEHREKLCLERKEAEKQAQVWRKEKALLEEAISKLMVKVDEQTKLTGLSEGALKVANAELKERAAYLEGEKEGLKRALEEERRKSVSIKEKGQNSSSPERSASQRDSCQDEQSGLAVCAQADGSKKESNSSQQAPPTGAAENLEVLEGTETELQSEKRSRQDAEEKLRALEASEAELTKRVESNLCLCLENEVNTAVVPCGHCLCSSCWTRHEKRHTTPGKKGYVSNCMSDM